MNERIFRGKRKDNNEWIEGDLLQVKWYNKPTTCGIMPQTPISCNYPVITESVGQFTGLIDMNGVRIFEGDIVSLTGGLIFKVVYGNCRYELVNRNDVSCFVLAIYKSENIKVIGNIHDNSELLKGGAE